MYFSLKFHVFVGRDDIKCNHSKEICCIFSSYACRQGLTPSRGFPGTEGGVHSQERAAPYSVLGSAQTCTSCSVLDTRQRKRRPAGLLAIFGWCSLSEGGELGVCNAQKHLGSSVRGSLLSYLSLGPKLSLFQLWFETFPLVIFCMIFIVCSLQFKINYSLQVLVYFLRTSVYIKGFSISQPRRYLKHPEGFSRLITDGHGNMDFIFLRTRRGQLSTVNSHKGMALFPLHNMLMILRSGRLGFFLLFIHSNFLQVSEMNYVLEFYFS